jgi:hypothetical protein
MMASLSIILEPDIIKNSYVSFYTILSSIQTMTKQTIMILIFGQCRKNAVQPAHVYSQILVYPNRPIFKVFV